jgi:hypothetical protein
MKFEASINRVKYAMYSSKKYIRNIKRSRSRSHQYRNICSNQTHAWAADILISVVRRDLVAKCVI